MASGSIERRTGVDAQAVIVVTLLVLGVAALALLLWSLADVLLLVFAAVLTATVLRSIAEPLENRLGIASPWSVLLACLLIASVLAGFAVLLGGQIRHEIEALTVRLPGLIADFEEDFGLREVGDVIAERLQAFVNEEGSVRNVAGFTLGTFGVLVNLVLVMIAGVYFALRPEFYRRGLLLLFPKPVRPALDSATANAGQALRLWLVGQLVAMAGVGVLTTAGLLAIGMPSALALGFLAGVADFVPIIGPFLAVIPAVLVAFSEGTTMVIWVIILYILIQQVEGNVLVPLIQRRVVQLPPVVTLFALIGAGVLFGPPGVVLATPLAVVCLVLVKQLYIRDTLDERTSVPGEGRTDS